MLKVHGGITYMNVQNITAVSPDGHMTGKALTDSPYAFSPHPLPSAAIINITCIIILCENYIYV